MIDPEKFQGDVMKWYSHNFCPPSNSHWATFGIVEEVGRLMSADACIFSEPEKASTEHFPQFRSAVGGVAISCAAFCGLQGLSLMQLAEKHADDFSEPLYTQAEIRLGFTIVAGEICRAQDWRTSSPRSNGCWNRQDDVAVERDVSCL